MKFSGQRTTYAYPIVIPPVTHKAAILHQDLTNVWSGARDALLTSTDIVVFGYSCPHQDFESANLISRSIRNNKILEGFSVVDPSPETFQRYVDVTGLNRMFFYRSAKAFLEEST